MDLDEWEFLSDDGYLDLNEDGGKQEKKLDSKGVFEINYFCSSPSSRVHNQIVHLPIELEPRIAKPPEIVLVNDSPKEVGVVAPSERIKDFEAVEAERVKVFFKIKESEFVDMKMDSPKSTSRGILPPIDALKFEDKGEDMETNTSPKRKVECEEDNNNGFNIWKWSLTGVGAICSFGVAAATICVLYFGTHQKKNKQERTIRFQIYSDRRIKQVVHQATKLNDAISAARSVPMSRAQISFGGYYDGP